MRRGLLVALLALSPAPLSAQDHVLCSSSVQPPFIVTTGAPFQVTWLMDDMATENNVSVPNRVDGFYLQIDASAKVDIGKPPAGPPCSTTSYHPGDFPYTYKTATGVAKGNHTLKISAWNYVLDGNGNATTNRQESTVVSVPFSAGDPTLYGPPIAPLSVVITRDPITRR